MTEASADTIAAWRNVTGLDVTDVRSSPQATSGKILAAYYVDGIPTGPSERIELQIGGSWGNCLGRYVFNGTAQLRIMEPDE